MIITVVGLGVIGGSFVKALKDLGHQVYGIDIDQKTLKSAKDGGYIIEGYQDGKEKNKIFSWNLDQITL